MIPTCNLLVVQYVDLLEKSLFLYSQEVNDDTYGLKDNVLGAWDIDGIGYTALGKLKSHHKQITQAISAGYAPLTVNIPVRVLSNVIDLIKDNAVLLLGKHG